MRQRECLPKSYLLAQKPFLITTNKYRKLSQDPQKLENSPSAELIRETNKMQISPAPFGLIKRKGKVDEINVRHYNIGNNFWKALGKTIKHIKPKALLLGSNKNNIGITSIIKNLTDNLEKLDLSENRIGLKSMIDFTWWMKSKAITAKLVLRYLNLSGNKLGDDSLSVLWKGLKSSKPTLRVLDLSKNHMGDAPCRYLGKFLEGNYQLEILNLSWNRITSVGGTQIFIGLQEGKSWRNMNISHNILGKQQSFELVEAIQWVANEETLKHLDLSFNRLSKVVCERLGQLLMDNHTLFGLHLEGNQWYVDKYGFVRIDDKITEVDHEKHHIVYPRNLDGFSTTMKFSKIAIQKYQPTSNWWVCEGWTEQTFVFKNGVSYPDVVDPVHIHFEYNFFRPEFMRPDVDGNYVYTTMCPPGKIKYFFTIDKYAVFARDHPHTGKKKLQEIKDIQMYDEIRTYKLPVFNMRYCDQGEVLNDCYMSMLQTWYPRQRIIKYKKKIEYRIRDLWEVHNSVFCDYTPDTQELIDKLFEWDWGMVHKPYVKSEEELANIKKELKKWYWIIRDAFKYYSSISSSTGSGTFSITLNSFTDYLKQWGVYKKNTISFSETDTLFYSITKRDKPTSLNPGNSIIRYQFLEIIMKIGLKHSKKKNGGEAIREFWDEIILKSLPQGKAEDFRREKLWNAECDNVLRHHLNLLKEVYANYSGGMSKPGEDKFMAPAEFERIFSNSELINSNFATRDWYVSFNLAIQSKVDEYSSNSHLRMNFVEFLEGISRAAEYLSLGPPSDNIREAYKKFINTEEIKTSSKQKNKEADIFLEGEGDDGFMQDEEGAFLSYDEHVNQPLHKKIENLLPFLLAYWTSLNFKRKWKWPRKNPHTGLYTDVKDSRVKELKSVIVKGINKLIISRFNLKEIVKKKGLKIKLKGM